MSRKKHIKAKIGKPPGTLIYHGERRLDDVNITLTEYNLSEYKHQKIDSVESLKEIISLKSDKTRWINVNGLSNIKIIEEIGNMFNIHLLVLEDIMNSYQRPKAEIYSDHIFTVLKDINFSNDHLSIGQVSLLIINNCIISFCDEKEDPFQPVYSRIENGYRLFRTKKSDYLFYVLIDLLIDRYFLVMEEFSERIDVNQEKLLSNPEKEDLHIIQNLKKDLQRTRHAILPNRDLLNLLLRRDSELISKDVELFFRDTLDHQIQIIENLETTRDSILTLLDIYLSSISNKMNEVMKVLTIIATIFIPLTFIAGVYGMNFEYIPELSWKYSYFVLWGVMLVIGIALGLFFKKKHWL